MEAVLVGVVAGALLLGVWVVSNRRHVRGHPWRNADWAGADAQPELWTSAARCPFCGARGGLLEAQASALSFTCLACRRRHRRADRG